MERANLNLGASDGSDSHHHPAVFHSPGIPLESWAIAAAAAAAAAANNSGPPVIDSISTSSASQACCNVSKGLDIQDASNPGLLEHHQQEAKQSATASMLAQSQQQHHQSLMLDPSVAVTLEFYAKRAICFALASNRPHLPQLGASHDSSINATETNANNSTDNVCPNIIDDANPDKSNNIHCNSATNNGGSSSDSNIGVPLGAPQSDAAIAIATSAYSVFTEILSTHLGVSSTSFLPPSIATAIPFPLFIVTQLARLVGLVILPPPSLRSLSYAAAAAAFTGISASQKIEHVNSNGPLLDDLPPAFPTDWLAYEAVAHLIVALRTQAYLLGPEATEAPPIVAARAASSICAPGAVPFPDHLRNALNTRSIEIYNVALDTYSEIPMHLTHSGFLDDTKNSLRFLVSSNVDPCSVLDNLLHTGFKYMFPTINPAAAAAAVAAAAAAAAAAVQHPNSSSAPLNVVGSSNNVNNGNACNPGFPVPDCNGMSASVDSNSSSASLRDLLGNPIACAMSSTLAASAAAAAVAAVASSSTPTSSGLQATSSATTNAGNLHAGGSCFPTFNHANKMPLKRTRKTTSESASASLARIPRTLENNGENGQKRLKHADRNVWSKEEEDALEEAMAEFGSRYSTILAMYGPNGTRSTVLAKRGQIQLKDKARNMRLRRERAGLDPGPFIYGIKYSSNPDRTTIRRRIRRSNSSSLNDEDDDEENLGLPDHTDTQNIEPESSITHDILMNVSERLAEASEIMSCEKEEIKLTVQDFSNLPTEQSVVLSTDVQNNSSVSSEPCSDVQQQDDDEDDEEQDEPQCNDDTDAVSH